MGNHNRRIGCSHEKPSRSPPVRERVEFSSLSQALLVADYMSFSRAARVLGVRQSAVSRRIQALEDELGVSLFERQLNGVRPTIAGERFFDRTRAALAEIDHAIKDAGAAGRGAEGVIRVGIPPFDCSGFLCDLLCGFQDAQPEVVFDYFAWPPRRSVAGIMERRLDVAFVVDGMPAPGCDTKVLWSTEICVALPAGHPLSGCEAIEWALLKDERFIIGRDATGARLDDYASENIVKAGNSILLETHDISQDWTMRLVARGFGISLVNGTAMESPYPGVTFRPLAGDDTRISYCAVWLPGNDNPALRRFLSLARSMSAERTRPRVQTIED
jgi:DNA-binding transcriptional LysR family regulator